MKSPCPTIPSIRISMGDKSYALSAKLSQVHQNPSGLLANPQYQYQPVPAFLCLPSSRVLPYLNLQAPRYLLRTADQAQRFPPHRCLVVLPHRRIMRLVYRMSRRRFFCRRSIRIRLRILPDRRRFNLAAARTAPSGAGAEHWFNGLGLPASFHCIISASRHGRQSKGWRASPPHTVTFRHISGELGRQIALPGGLGGPQAELLISLADNGNFFALNSVLLPGSFLHRRTGNVNTLAVALIPLGLCADGQGIGCFSTVDRMSGVRSFTGFPPAPQASAKETSI